MLRRRRRASPPESDTDALRAQVARLERALKATQDGWVEADRDRRDALRAARASEAATERLRSTLVARKRRIIYLERQLKSARRKGDPTP